MPTAELHRRYERSLLLTFCVVWGWLAIAPIKRSDWLVHFNYGLPAPTKSRAPVGITLQGAHMMEAMQPVGPFVNTPK
ncbi:hypothetical protein [Pseudomonas brassicacearum]|uniref:hypothetical protein n=1 Tax=Pseudomonas brassicacearum TaxID=930166 RepID=UPI001D016DDA|nr:hypothetical protein [Pseudomonas brassicacearum]